jgi:ribosomal protein S18 acetylase RimI-like enzyme
LDSDGKLVIDLIAVTKAHRGSGLARGMIAFAASTFTQFHTMLVATQIANIPSMRLYEGIGFRIVGAQYILHRHR